MSSYYYGIQMKMTLIIMVVGCLLLVSCSKITEEEDEWGETGTVSLGLLCWLIVSDAGITYEPINLDEAFKSEDLSVKFEYKERTDMDSICMQGRIIELIRIEEL